MVRIINKMIWIAFLSLLLLGVPVLSGRIADLFSYRAVDPDGAFAWISVHHIVQALIFLAIMLMIKKLRAVDFGFSWGNKTRGRQYVIKFTLIFGMGSLVSYIISVISQAFETFAYPLNALNIVGYLSFQLLLSGPSEELIFRAFAITLFAWVLKGRIFGGKLSSANLVAAVIFGMAHMSFSLSPFSVSYNPYQVAMSFVLGCIYGDCYEKTGSMYYPMILHSISNVIMVSFQIIATAVFS